MNSVFAVALSQTKSWLLEDMYLSAHVGKDGVGAFGFPPADAPSDTAFVVSGA